MGRCFAVYLICFLLFSCANEAPLEFSQKTVNSSQIAGCNNKKCPEIIVDYEHLSEAHPLARVINEQNQSFIAAIISSAVMPNQSENTVQGAVTAFVTNFQDYMGDFPEAVEMYELDIQNFVAFTDDRYLGFQTDYYIYTGGAHGYGGQEFLVLDPQTGKQLLLDEIVKNETAFTQFAESQFRKQNDIGVNANINSTGFWFEEDAFYLSDTYGLTEEGFHIVYQVYDISSYVEGPITLTIPWQEIEPYLK